MHGQGFLRPEREPRGSCRSRRGVPSRAPGLSPGLCPPGVPMAVWEPEVALPAMGVRDSLGLVGWHGWACSALPAWPSWYAVAWAPR